MHIPVGHVGDIEDAIKDTLLEWELVLLLSCCSCRRACSVTQATASLYTHAGTAYRSLALLLYRCSPNSDIIPTCSAARYDR